MRNAGYIFVVLVGVINIVLNTFALKSAHTAQGGAAIAAPHGAAFVAKYKAALLSRPFRIAFLVGLCSLLGLVAVYVSGIPLARGILLMGATSIIGGTVFGVIHQKKGLEPVEWLLLTCIAIFYGLRLFSGLVGQK